MAQALESTHAIPGELAERAQRRSAGNLKFVMGGLLLLGVVVLLMVQATLSTGAYYMTVDEVVQQRATLVGERVRVSGQVVAGSEDWNVQEVTLRFRITDAAAGEGGAELPIVFYGPRPDNFQRAAEAIAEGTLLPDGSFQANDLLLKCPSRYEEQPEEVHVQATH